MTDLVVANGRIVTQNRDRAIIEDGAVAIDDRMITAVGPTDEIVDIHEPDRVIDATGGAVVPGFVNPHTHVSDLLLRGSFAEDRGLLDWLYNVKRPGTLAMTPEDHAAAARLFCVEAIRAGITTFVENDTEVVWDDWSTIEAKLEIYESSGIRNVYGAGMVDTPPEDEFRNLIADIQSRADGIDHPPIDTFVVETGQLLAEVDSLIKQYQGTADGRQSVWPAPVVLQTTSKAGFQGAYDLAERHDVMTTAHVAEAAAEDQRSISSVEYLRNVGYLGERAVLGHCVQVDERDVRILEETDTAVAHNYTANMRLATGFAPVREMLASGVTVGLGTDNTILNDTVNPLADVGEMASGHKGYHRDPGVLPAQTALDMITIEAARAIGRGNELGSIVAGKQADITIVDLDYPHLTPCPDPVFGLIHAARGHEVETVICAGTIVMEEREIHAFDDTLEAILSSANTRSKALVSRVGIE
jgi:atrazine chlorohydrolase/5-methylthioadenosine/S-adenosylhomocysteine deaminase